MPAEDRPQPVHTTAPTVFMSYSHDSGEHKAWVAGLTTDLRRNGVEAFLDQWSLRLGMDIPSFMESGIRNANRVCIICTPEYARKADAGKGGVGYEKMIVTGELYSNLGSTKFIPVVVAGSGEEALPSFLKGKYFVDFRESNRYAEKLEELLRDLHDVPVTEPPPVGRNPFAIDALDEVALPPAEALPAITRGTEWTPEQVYDTCTELLRHNDVPGWRLLAKDLRATLDPRLGVWLESITGREFRDHDAFLSAADAAVKSVMPLITQAISGVESSLPAFSDQRSLVDDFLSLSNWPTGGLSVILELPESLVYVYQYLHGATALLTGQPKLAVALGGMGVSAGHGPGREPLWQARGMTGWPKSLGGSFTSGWRYLLGLQESCPWLRKVFTREHDWEVALRAYSALLSSLDLANVLKSSEKQFVGANAFEDPCHYTVPPLYLLCDRQIRERAFALAFRDARSTELVAEASGVSPATLRAHWGKWMDMLLTSLSANFHVSPSQRVGPLP